MSNTSAALVSLQYCLKSLHVVEYELVYSSFNVNSRKPKTINRLLTASLYLWISDWNWNVEHNSGGSKLLNDLYINIARWKFGVIWQPEDYVIILLYLPNRSHIFHKSYISHNKSYISHNKSYISHNKSYISHKFYTLKQKYFCPDRHAITFRSPVRRSNHWATRTQMAERRLYFDVGHFHC